MVHVWREEDAVDVGAVCLKGSYGDEGGGVVVLQHAPDVDHALGECQLAHGG